MAGKSITTDTIVKTCVGNGIFVFQYRIITHTEQRVHIVRKEIPDQAVPALVVLSPTATYTVPSESTVGVGC